jgi:hypothetical protein
VLSGKFVFAELRWFHVSFAIFPGAIFPGMALFVGTLPYTSAAQLGR